MYRCEVFPAITPVVIHEPPHRGRAHLARTQRDVSEIAGCQLVLVIIRPEYLSIQRVRPVGDARYVPTGAVVVGVPYDALQFIDSISERPGQQEGEAS